MDKLCAASTEFRGAGNCVHVVPAKPIMIATMYGETPLKDFLDSISPDSPVDPYAFFGMIGILKKQQGM